MKDPIFKANPEADCYFETSDGQKFFKDTDAKNHARTLEVKKIKKIINPDYTTEVAEIEEVIAETDNAVENLDVDFTEVKTGELDTLEVDENEATQIGQVEETVTTVEATVAEPTKVDTPEATQIGQAEETNTPVEASIKTLVVPTKKKATTTKPKTK